MKKESWKKEEAKEDKKDKKKVVEEAEKNIKIHKEAKEKQGS